uniref:NADH dehydrogenase subunit 4L n=1 Tax=Epophthalmia elegans TaxID=346097 RepID=UPI0014366D5F|nr:NADH dehydrogenase subunit 4L [Epophthalmia elegans]QIH29904.1 NADH dehydrogenase subunit 4L [Epophthalmia elegans]
MDLFFNFLFYLLIFIGLWSFVSKRKHLLSVLLSLEFIVLSLFIYIGFILMQYNMMYFLMYFLTFGVCEGALGLSILVLMIRTHGNDYFNSFNMLQC